MTKNGKQIGSNGNNTSIENGKKVIKKDTQKLIIGTVEFDRFVVAKPRGRKETRISGNINLNQKIIGEKPATDSAMQIRFNDLTISKYADTRINGNVEIIAGENVFNELMKVFLQRF